MKFQDLRLSEPLLRAIGEKGYTDPTPIQQQAIPPVLEGRDLQGCAQTGTGKTAAFTLPMLQLLAAEPAPKGRRPIRALVLTPTRELAIQIDECCRDYARYTPIRHCVIFGGVNQRPQVDALQKGVDLLVATPGRLLDLIGQGYVTLDTIRFFVLDEADRMLDMGFIHDIRRILPLLPERRQTLFFSATMPESIAALAAKILRNPVLVTVTPPASVVETIAQTVHFAEKAEKSQLLIDLLSASDAQQVLVFSRTKHGADKLAKILNRAGIRSCAIHGNKSQNARVKAMNDFKSGECRVMIATDIAARGIDIDQLPLVINYELPEVAETYVHRIGRTGRAGHEGAAWSFCSEDEFEYLCDIQKLTGLTIPTEGPVPEYALRKAAPARKPAQKAAQRPARTQEPKPARNAGAKSAQRLAFHIMNMPKDQVEQLTSSITDARLNVQYCKCCYTLTDQELCPICSSDRRDHKTIMVVENTRDLAAYEKTGKYEGVYHVLHGAISPMLGIGPNDIRLKELMQRLQGDIKEVIIATNSSLEGETTAMYISKLIKPTGIRVSRIASGVPVGGDLEYIDEVTLLRALEGRVEL